MTTVVKDRDEVLQDLKKEIVELREHINKLWTALFSDGFFENVGKEQYFLMSKQVAGMESYYDALQCRIINLMSQDAQDN